MAVCLCSQSDAVRIRRSGPGESSAAANLGAHPRRGAQREGESVTQDWAAVARAMNRRLTELGMRQRDLAERAHVSQAIVRELQRNTAQRKRLSLIHI